MPTKIPTQRCSWADSDELMTKYHDEEWGVPNHDSRSLWEMLMLEGFQAGLAWITVLRKREAFRKAFARFEPRKVPSWRSRNHADAGQPRHYPLACKDRSDDRWCKNLSRHEASW